MTISGKPQNYAKILVSPDREEWKKAIVTKYSNLEYSRVFKWVEKLPEKKKAVEGCLICKKKLNKFG